jgi:prepilin-type N-terminal cleavage/methylation domain-containing protein
MSRSDPRAGFTLLEVMAAVSLLGILYTVLAGIAIRGLRSEGDSRRRLEASMQADRHLADIEASLDSGTLPESGTSESDEGSYQISIEVTEFDLGVALANLPEGVPGAADGDESDAEPISGIQEIRLTVSWLDGADERRVTRTTWARDLGLALPGATP